MIRTSCASAIWLSIRSLRDFTTRICICGRSRGFDDKWCKKAAQMTAKSYRRAMEAFARMGIHDVWNAYNDVASALQDMEGAASKATRRRVAGDLKKAFSKTNIRAFEKLVQESDGKMQVVADPPDIVPLKQFVSAENRHSIEEGISKMFKEYRTTMQEPYEDLLDHYRLIGMAQKVVGVGSVGTRCWIAGFVGKELADPLVLQIKEAGRSSISLFYRTSEDADSVAPIPNGERVARGQRLMQATSTAFLGWASTLDEHGTRRDYYMRQLWNWKMSIDLDHANADELEMYSQLCAWCLAHARARTGDRVAISSYLGSSDRSDRALSEFALSYADQNDADYKQFLKRI